MIIDNSEYIGEAADESLPGVSECALTVTADGSVTFYEDNSEFPVSIDGNRLTMDLTEYAGLNMKYVFIKNQTTSIILLRDG